MFSVGQSVMARNYYRSGAAWLPGVIGQQLGPLTYLVDVSEGRLWKQHVDHIKDLHARPTEIETWPEPQVGGSSEASETSPSLPDLPLPMVEPTEVPTSVPVPIATQKQYPRRTHQKPDWYHDRVWYHDRNL